MSAPPATALDLVWRVVRQARWNHPTSGFVADVLSCYFDRAVYYVAKVGEDALRVRIEEGMLEDFRRAFPDARPDEGYEPTNGLVFVRLPIPPLGWDEEGFARSFEETPAEEWARHLDHSKSA